MTQSSRSIYDSPRLAEAYARSRPPVHQNLIRAVAYALGVDGDGRRRLNRALDVGCGAGLSTAALEPLARYAVGLEPEPAMLAHRRAVAPRASFTIGRAERLPFAAGAFDIITAAGSLNYADLDLFLPDVERVLAARGVLIVYDFSAGRRFRESDVLDEWYDAFEQRYPPPPGYALDVRGIDYERAGLRLTDYEELEVAVPMTFGSYVPYAMSEHNVESAVSRGASEEEIREWCRSTLAQVFGGEPSDVLFDAYIAYVRRA